MAIPFRFAYTVIFAIALCGCLHTCKTEGVSRAMYDTVALSFLMLAREAVANGKSAWNQGSGVARISTWV